MSSASASSAPGVSAPSSGSASISIPDQAAVAFFSELAGGPSTASSASVKSSPLPTSSASSGRRLCGCAWLGALRRRLPRARRSVARAVMSLPVRRVAGGLVLALALLLVGLVGSLALHQMTSPEIEALMRERKTLQSDVLALRLQVENATRIAESRLEMIHLLETELERQAVQAAEAAAAATTPVATDSGGHAVPAGAYEGEDRDGRFRPSFVLPTILYTWLLGATVLLSVLYRIFLLVQGELRTQRKLERRRQLHGSSGLPVPPPSLAESSGRATPPMSPPRSPNPTATAASDATAAANGSLSPTAAREPSPQCYKRAPGSSPIV